MDDGKVLEDLMRRNLITQAKRNYGLGNATAVCETTAGQWGTDMDLVSQVYKFTITLKEGLRSLTIEGTVCLTERPGRDDPPEAEGQAGDWKFQFTL